MPDDDNSQPDLPEVPMMMRRRLNRMGRMAARVAYDVGGLDEAVIAYCSRYGDSVLTLSLLDDIVDGELPSPAGFSMAVHNAIAGWLSIVAKNRNAHTAVASGPESLAAGLLEASMLITEQPDRAVMVLYCHEPLAPTYRKFQSPSDRPISLALMVGRTQTRAGIHLSAKPRNSGGNDATEPEALSFIRFLLSARPEGTFAGVGLEWMRMA